ncbi:MAG: methyltransferase domain-containing protein [Casimicrobiaceae bacterium]|nr:methyltransferase domain-containing protein [Casimicrobiaceae bacterium]
MTHPPTVTPTFRDLRDPLGLALNEAQRLIDTGNFERAASRLQDLRVAFPKDGRVYLCASRLAARLGQPAQWVACAERACELMPAFAPARLEFARALYQTGEHAEALAQAAYAVQLAPGSLEVLAVAYELARACRSRSDALRFIQQALAISGEDPTIRRSAALELLLSGRPADALALAEGLVRESAQDELARSIEVDALFALGEHERALARLEALAADFPERERYRFFLAMRRGEKVSEVPSELVADLFDRHAETFDRTLLGGLRYRAPELVAQAIRTRFPSLKVSVLDLGCGTGLLGEALGQPKGYLIGVDLSRKMLEQAAEKRLYDRLHHADLLEALSATDAAQYEVIAACDVFVYLGELAPIAREAAKVLRPNGLLVFTCECVAVPPEADGFALDQATQRYSHGHGYLKRILTEAGFVDIALEPVELRLEAGHPVRGVLVTARRPADS